MLLPAISTSTGLPNSSAAVSALGVMSARWPLETSAKGGVATSDPSCFFKLGDKLGRRLDLDAGFAPARLGRLQDLEARRDVDAVVGGGLFVDRLLLGLHDVGQRGVARLGEAQIGGDDRPQLQFDGLQAAVDLAR